MNQDLYQTIFRRKSIRKYDMAPLDDKVLRETEDFIGGLTPLFPGIKTRLTVVPAAEIKNMFAVKAPHYLLIFSEKQPKALINAGYLGQTMDLYFSSRGLGSCWLGMAKPEQALLPRDGLEFIIMLAFGNPAEPLRRSDAAGFRRKSLDEISSVPDAAQLLEPVRLAPSAVNRQPWFFYGSADDIGIGRVRLNPLTARVYDRLNQIDLGIALCHFLLSAGHLGREVRLGEAKEPAPKGILPVLSAALSKQ